MKVPRSVAERWENAKSLRNLAETIRKKSLSEHAYIVKWPEDVEARVHGHYRFVDDFADELFDLCDRLEAHADELECRCDDEEAENN